MKEIELRDLRKKREKHFLREDGLMVAQMFDDDIHYKNEDGYDEIDNSFVKNGEYYCNKSNSYKVCFHENTENLFMKMEFGNHYLCYHLKDRNLVPVKIEQVDSKLYQNVIYENIFDGIDFEYNVMPTKVKENIMIKNKESLKDQILFMIDTDLELLLNTDKSIDALFAREFVFKIEAPFIIGRNGKVLHDVFYELEKQEKGYLLKLIIDKDFILKSDLEYPIMIDPTITNSNSNGGVYDTYIYSGDTGVDKNNQDVLKVGVERVNGTDTINRSLIKFDLPTIGTGSQIVYAEMNLVGYRYLAGTDSKDMITVHQVTENWNEESADWNTMHDKYNVRVETVFESARSFYDGLEEITPTLCPSEITSLVKKWYADTPNYGILLKQNKEEYHNDVVPAFYSKNNQITGFNPKPILSIVYKNQNGLEPYMDYKSQTFTQGSTYVNSYNGNLTGIFEIASTKTGKMPVTLKLIYNTNDVVLNQNFGYGIGCNLNFAQRIKEVTIDSIHYLEYLDEDATLHYFKLIDNLYKDEDGLDLTIEKKDSECILTDKNNNKMYFTKSGSIFYLTKIQDISGNTVNIVYNPDLTIYSIKDANGQPIIITYDTDKITVLTTEETIVLNYTNDVLTSLVKETGTTFFTCNEKQLIQQITDENGLKKSYEYYDQVPYRVKKVSEIGIDDTVGNYFNVNYNFNSTTFIDHKNRAQSLTFNHYGNLESITTLKNHDDILNAYGESEEYGNEEYYDENTYVPIKNKLLNSEIPSKYVKNYLNNSSFEEDDLSSYLGYDNISLSISDEEAVSGFKSLKVVTTQSGQSFAISPDVPKGATYTFSAYLKNQQEVKVSLGYLNVDNEYIEKEITVSSHNTFKRYDVSIDYPSDAKKGLSITFTFNGLGTCYIDDIQLENGKVANQYNLLSYSDFSLGITDWNLDATDLETGESLSANELFEVVSLENDISALKVKMNPVIATSFMKSFPVKGKAGDTYYVSFWYKNKGLSGEGFLMYPIQNNVMIQFNYINDEDGQCIFPSKLLNPNEQEWQFFSTRFQALKDFDSIDLNFFQQGNVNDFYVTNICLFKDVRNVDYEYDERGNIITITDLTNEATTFDYDQNNELLKMMDPKGKSIYFEYDKVSTDHVITGISQTGIANKIEYDSCQNPILTKIVKNHKDITTGYYKLKLKGKNTYLRCDSSSITLKAEDCPLHNWYLEQIGDYYRLRHSILVHKFLTVFNNQLMITNNQDDSSLFQLIQKANNAYVIQSKSSNQYLKVNDTTLVLADFVENDSSFEFYIESVENEEFIENNAQYTANGKVITSTTDSLLHKTLYNFNQTTGLINFTVDPNGVTTIYTYDDQDRLISITTNEKIVNYTYNNYQLLDKITQGNKEYQFVYDHFLNIKQVKLNGVPLVTNNYEENNGNLLSCVYGNNQIISFEYDDFDRLKVKTRSDDTYHYQYDNNGSLVRILSNLDMIKYTYDMSKRVREYQDNDFSIEYIYDANGNIASKKYCFNDQEHSIYHTYNEEDVVSKTVFDNSEINYEYDALQRLKKTTGMINDDYQYVTNGKRTSTLIKQKGDYSYIYDRLNNITHIYNGDTLEHQYYYDDYSELVKEDDYLQNQTITYTYDVSGNIVSKKIYTLNTTALISENTYEYTNTNWEDQLTKFNNTVITYDAIGNPLTIGDTNLTWINGRQLKQYQDSNQTIQYKYNVDGIRTSKSVNNVETKYYLEGSKIIFEQRGNNMLYYMYNGFGNSVGFQYNNDIYYYLKNNQDDIIGITDCNHNVVAKYIYDSWGNIISIKDGNNIEVTSSTHIANINPFRYRSYYYDEDTKLYYLNSRYYNPLWGRFLNADNYISTNTGPLGHNMYLYCNNNNINCVDSNGNSFLRFALKVCQVIIKVNNIIQKEKAKKEIQKVQNIKYCTSEIKANQFQNILDINSATVKKETENMSFFQKLNYVNKNYGQGDRYDLKSKSAWKNITISFDGHVMEAQDIGNYHYGYTLRAMGIPQFIAVAGAGWNQMTNSNRNILWCFDKNLCDDPRDSYYIILGMQAYDKEH